MCLPDDVLCLVAEYGGLQSSLAMAATCCSLRFLFDPKVLSEERDRFLSDPFLVGIRPVMKAFDRCVNSINNIRDDMMHAQNKSCGSGLWGFLKHVLWGRRNCSLTTIRSQIWDIDIRMWRKWNSTDQFDNTMFPTRPFGFIATTMFVCRAVCTKLDEIASRLAYLHCPEPDDVVHPNRDELVKNYIEAANLIVHQVNCYHRNIKTLVTPAVPFSAFRRTQSLTMTP